MKVLKGRSIGCSILGQGKAVRTRIDRPRLLGEKRLEREIYEENKGFKKLLCTLENQKGQTHSHQYMHS